MNTPYRQPYQTMRWLLYIKKTTNNKNPYQIIPQQQILPSQVVITTTDAPDKAGVYAAQQGDHVLQLVSYNYASSESQLLYQEIRDLPNVTVATNLNESITSYNSVQQINSLWKWFLIFALISLLIEMLLLKYL